VTAAANWVTFAGVFLLCGVAGTRLLVEPGAAGRELGRLAMLAALVLLLGAGLRLLAQADSFLDPGEQLTTGTLRTILGSGWGRGLQWQAAAAAVALVTARSGRWMALTAAVLVALTLPLTGHAQEAPVGAVAGVALTGAHALAAGLWLGTLAVVLVRRRVLFGTQDGAELAVARVIGRFSPMALVCGATVLLTGVAEAVWLVGGWHGLIGTPYGRSLLLKVGLVVALLGVGAWNWRVVRPSLGSAGSATRLWRTATLELLLATAVLAVTSLLITRDPPGLAMAAAPGTNATAPTQVAGR